MSSKTISNLHVGIGGSYGGLAKTFNGAAAATQGFAGKLASVGGGIAKLGGIAVALAAPIAAAFTLYRAITSVTTALESIDIAAKVADRLGLTTEQLTGLQHAAELAGISSDELTGGLEFMLKNLGKAAEDGGAAAEAISGLGLSADQLVAGSPDAAFKAIADSLTAIQNPAERAAAVVKIFGKSGQALLPLLTSGAKGIAAAQAEAARLGLTFSRIDAAKVEEANDAITRLKAVGTGLAQRIAIGIAPVVDIVAQKLTALAVAVQPILSKVWGAIVGVFGQIYNFVAPWAISIYTAVATRWQAIVTAVVGFSMALYNALSATMGAIGAVIGAVWNAITAVWSFGTSLIGGQSQNAANQSTMSFGSIVDTLNELADTATFVFNSIEYALNNWQVTAELVGLSIIYAVVKLANEFVYYLTEVIPTAVGFVGACLIVGFTNDCDRAIAIFTNMGTNIVSIFKNLPGLISGKTSWDKVWTPLTQGFEAAVVEWPGIAEREIGTFEKLLESEIGDLEDKFSDGLADHLVKRNDDAAKAADNVVNNLKDAFKLPKIDAPEFTKPDPIVPTLSTDNLTLAITPEIKKASAIRIGSAEDQLLRHAGPLAAKFAPAPRVQAAAGATPAAPNARPVTTAPSKGMDDFWSAMKTEWKTQTDWLRKIETNTKTPQLAVAGF